MGIGPGSRTRLRAVTNAGGTAGGNPAAAALPSHVIGKGGGRRVRRPRGTGPSAPRGLGDQSGTRG